MPYGSKPFAKMVGLLVEKYGMAPSGAEKLVAKSSEPILTVREQIHFQQEFKRLSEEMNPSEARVEALKRVINSSGVWHTVTDEAHRYQLGLRLTS